MGGRTRPNVIFGSFDHASPYRISLDITNRIPAMNRILAGEQQRHSIGIVTQSGLMLGTAIPLAHLAHRAVATLGTSGLSEKNSRVPMPAEAAIVSPELAFKVLP